MSICERTISKPFNPLLGETYELVTKDFIYLAEQVSHHPPVTANYCRSNKGLYTVWTNQRTHTKFTGKLLTLPQQYRMYIDLDKFGERYEVTYPLMSVHNLIIGKMYIDIGDTMTVKKVPMTKAQMLGDEEVSCSMNFTRRGWFTKEEYKV